MIDRERRDPPLDGTGLRRLGLGTRPVVAGAFAFSVALHAFAILIYPALFEGIRPEMVLFPFAAPDVAPDGMEVLRVVEVDVTSDPETPEDPDEIEEVEAVAEIAVPNLSETPVIELPPPGLTPAERLRPQLSDRRLFAPLPESFRTLTLEQREELAVAGRLADWYDSVSAEAAAAARWTDWTFTDGDGDRWGISDGQLHLGGLTLPLPVFDAAPGAAREYMWQWDEIARQGASVQIRESVRDRIEAIRARRDRERAEAQADTTGGNR